MIFHRQLSAAGRSRIASSVLAFGSGQLTYIRQQSDFQRAIKQFIEEDLSISTL